MVEILRSHPLVLLIRSLPHCLSSDQERHSAINQWQSSKALTRSSFVNSRSSQARSCLFVCGFSFGSLRLPTPAPSYAVISQPSWECWLYLRRTWTSIWSAFIWCFARQFLIGSSLVSAFFLAAVSPSACVSRCLACQPRFAEFQGPSWYGGIRPLTSSVYWER